jgi:hypothetical protein
MTQGQGQGEQRERKGRGGRGDQLSFGTALVAAMTPRATAADKEGEFCHTPTSFKKLGLGPGRSPVSKSIAYVSGAVGRI